MTTPAVSPRLLSWFRWYCRGYLARSFHAIRILKQGLPIVAADVPLVVYLNHASWWDPLIGILAAERFFPNRSHFAPIDSQSLGRYKFFERLGFFGIDLHSPAGGAKFLRRGLSLLRQPGTALWITPQGRFVDSRLRPIRFQPGLEHLLRRLRSGVLIPLAIEFTFWEERTPEALLAFGEPIYLDQHSDLVRPSSNTLLEGRLQTTMDLLAAESIARRAASFELLLSGAAGVGGVYDLWRRFRSRLQGRAFQREHGDSP